MSKLPLLAFAGAAAIALAATAPVPAHASAVHLTPAFGSVASESNVVEVRRRHRRNSWIALGVGSAIVGGMIAAQRPAYGYAPAYGYGPTYGYGPQRGYVSSGWDECAARFRSLRADGTYTTYDGRQVLCPYLR
jgi:hypothetical protein